MIFLKLHGIYKTSIWPHNFKKTEKAWKRGKKGRQKEKIKKEVASKQGKEERTRQQSLQI